MFPSDRTVLCCKIDALVFLEFVPRREHERLFLRSQRIPHQLHNLSLLPPRFLAMETLDYGLVFFLFLSISITCHQRAEIGSVSETPFSFQSFR